VVPGDDRVACQHCPARVRYAGSPSLAWIDDDASDSSGLLWCLPAADTRQAIWHKPMPTVRISR
jgi:hypothetical protein